MKLPIPTISWRRGRLHIIDQTRLPVEVTEKELLHVEDVWQAIRRLEVRGAPAIGVCAAYGVALAARQAQPGQASEAVRQAIAYLATSRPTAVNLFWALDRMERAAQSCDEPGLAEHLEAEAVRIHEEDLELCQSIGQHGKALITSGAGVLTHCNAGGLATSGYGTALAVMYAAHEAGTAFRVFADETRPLLQGARLTAWELQQAGIDVTVICDNMAAQVMREGRVDLVVVGADRIAANGDAANKIGTYGLAVLAKAHDIPFYVAAPASTFDFACPSGAKIPIEEREAEEITHGFGARTVPEGVEVYNPAFDVTPAELIAGFVTELGLLRPPFEVAKMRGVSSALPREQEVS